MYTVEIITPILTADRRRHTSQTTVSSVQSVYTYGSWSRSHTYTHIIQYVITRLSYACNYDNTRLVRR